MREQHTKSAGIAYTSRLALSQAPVCVAMLLPDGSGLTPDVRAGRSGRNPDRRHGGEHRGRSAHRVGRGLARARLPGGRDDRNPGRRLRGLPSLPRGALVRSALFETPRPVPGRLLPTLGGGLVLALALPVFLLAGWRLAGWALASVL